MKVKNSYQRSWFYSHSVGTVVGADDPVRVGFQGKSSLGASWPMPEPMLHVLYFFIVSCVKCFTFIKEFAACLQDITARTSSGYFEVIN